MSKHAFIIHSLSEGIEAHMRCTHDLSIIANKDFCAMFNIPHFIIQTNLHCAGQAIVCHIGRRHSLIVMFCLSAKRHIHAHVHAHTLCDFDCSTAKPTQQKEQKKKSSINLLMHKVYCAAGSNDAQMIQDVI